MKPTLLETHAPREEEGGGRSTREWFQKEAKETTPTGFQNNLELRLGISLSTPTPTATSTTTTITTATTNNNNCNNTTSDNQEYKDMSSTSGETKAGPNPSRFMTTLDGLVLNGLVPSPSGTKRWFTEPSCSAFIHPWSLAARQQKAVFEQAHHRLQKPSSTPAVPRFTPPTPPPIVGWPPVRASRRNLVSLIKPEMDGEKDAKKAKVTEDEEKKSLPDQVTTPPTMFVKVNMEGFAVGRKINLKAHDSYESLSRALQKMFTNFLSTTYSNNAAQEEQDEDHNYDYILLYEDHEGDRMLVGDVPWELFITSVKRLRIAHSPKTEKSEDEKVTDEEK